MRDPLIKILALILLFSLNSRADEVLAPYSYFYAGKTVTALIGQTTEGVAVNDLCLEKLQQCTALQVYRGKSAIAKIQKVKDGNFSGAYCEHFHGNQLYLHEKNKTSESQFCVFADLTMIDAKALYRSHAQRSVKK